MRTLLILAAVAAVGSAQTPLQFTWKNGEKQSFAVRHATTVTETLRDEKTGKPTASTRSTVVLLTKEWTVSAVDAAGAGTLELRILAMKQDHTAPDGTITTIDSANAEDAKQLAGVLNAVVLTAKVDARGQVLEAKAADPTGEERLKTDLPFRTILPATAVQANAEWERPFAVTLDPPLGTGEKHDLMAKYTFRGVREGVAVLGLATSLKNPPKSAAEMQPLLGWLWQGDLFVDTRTGRYAGAKLQAAKELPNHAGDGTKFEFRSEYTEAAK
jgi:hypothetical protein